MNQQADKVIIDGLSLTLEQFEAVALRQAPVGLDPVVYERVRAGREMVESLVAGGQVVYGITTGFGRLADTRISAQEVDELQINLIRSHAAGSGAAFPTPVVRGMLLLRANTLARGHSGVRPKVLELLLECLNRGVIPVVPAQGSVGASGDLAPLAHMALVLMGEGRAEYRGGILPGGEALAQAGLVALRPGAKEGLALLNGLCAMASVGALALGDARHLLL